MAVSESVRCLEDESASLDKPLSRTLVMVQIRSHKLLPCGLDCFRMEQELLPEYGDGQWMQSAGGRLEGPECIDNSTSQLCEVIGHAESTCYGTLPGVVCSDPSRGSFIKVPLSTTG